MEYDTFPYIRVEKIAICPEVTEGCIGADGGYVVDFRERLFIGDSHTRTGECGEFESVHNLRDGTCATDGYACSVDNCRICRYTHYAVHETYHSACISLKCGESGKHEPGFGHLVRLFGGNEAD